MKILRRLAAVWVGKFIIKVSKLFGGQGSATAGQIVLKIYPEILMDLSAQIKKGIIMITGTNGKTTTNNMIYSILKKAGYRVVCNNAGANMLTGVTTAFVNCTSLTGKLRADYAAIEVDEASLRKVGKFVVPNYLIINNIFRDQLDRYGEIDITIELIKEAIDKWPDVKLILNGDDPLSAHFGKKTGKPSVFYGIDRLDVEQDDNEMKEGRFCQFCGNQYEYEYYHYSQLGKYKCPKCGFERPKLDVVGKNVVLGNKLSFDVINDENIFNLQINYKGFYNIHNALAAISGVLQFGIDVKTIIDSLGEFKPQAGRMERFNIAGKDIVLNLSKNPAGFNQAIMTVMGDNRNKSIIITINDNAQDGRDISWLWDVDFERFLAIDSTIGTYIITGTRKEDMALRLKYAGIAIDKIHVAHDMEDGVETAVEGKGDIIYALINYTALFETRKILKKRAGVLR